MCTLPRTVLLLVVVIWLGLAFVCLFVFIIILTDSPGLSAKTPSCHFINWDSFVSFSFNVPYDLLCFSYLPVYAEVQQPHVYLQNSHVEFSNLYLGVPTKSNIMLVNGTLLPTWFHWGKVIEPQGAAAKMCVTPPP